MLGLKFRKKKNLAKMSTVELMYLYEETNDPATREQIVKILEQRGWKRSRHGWRKEVGGEALAV